LYFLASCSNIKTVEPPKELSDILLFKVAPPKKGQLSVYPTAAGQGYLVLSGNCLYLSPRKNSHKGLFGIIWPWNYSLEINGKSIKVVNGSLKKIVEIGDFIKFGGGAGNSTMTKKYEKCTDLKIKNVFVGNPEV
jgi:hypothetical protein